MFGVVLIDIMSLPVFENQDQRNIKVSIVDLPIQIGFADSDVHADNATGTIEVRITFVYQSLAIFRRIVLKREKDAMRQLAGRIGHRSSFVN